MPIGSDLYAKEVLSTDVKPSGAFAGQHLIETDTGSVFEWTGSKWINIRLFGSGNFHDADVHTKVFNKVLHRHTATETTLSADSAVNDTQLNVADTTGFVVGDPIHINTGALETTHPFILSITPGAPGILTLDRRLDIAHSLGDVVTKTVVNMATVAGTLASPQIYWAGPEADVVWHITHLSASMGHNLSADMGKFGGIAALTNGVVLRSKVDSVYNTFTNWKTNAEINTDTGNIEFYTRSGGQGTYGTTLDGAFKDRTGGVMRLDGDLGDMFELYVQDDLTGLVFFGMKVQGHIESA